jgi:hypothetical protein
VRRERGRGREKKRERGRKRGRERGREREEERGEKERETFIWTSLPFNLKETLVHYHMTVKKRF